MNYIVLILDLTLIGATAYGAYAVKLEHPYAFVACVYACGHAWLSLIQSTKEEESKIKEISDSIMEILPISLVNIELFKASSLADLAPVHWFFIIPVTFDMIARLFTEEGEDSATETLKGLTILTFLISLSYLAFNDEKYMYAGLVVLVLLRKYGSILFDYIKECSARYVVVTSEIGFYIVLSIAIEGGGA